MTDGMQPSLLNTTLMLRATNATIMKATIVNEHLIQASDVAHTICTGMSTDDGMRSSSMSATRHIWMEELKLKS
jgi:hypothetical protein